MNIAWVTPKWPFPVTDGARQATAQLVKQLTRRGVAIHLCSITDEHSIDVLQAKREFGVTSVTLVQRERTTRFAQLKNLIRHPFIPLTLTPYSASAVFDQMQIFFKEKSVDLAVFDGLHAAAWQMRDRNGSLVSSFPIVYRAHNVESEIWFRASRDTRNPLKKVFLAYEAWLVRRFELRLANKARHVFPVSSRDENLFRDLGIQSDIVTLPIGIEVEEKSRPAEPVQNPRRKLLFVGRLDWPPNREGLRWFLDKVWPLVIDKADDITLTIVGSGDRSWLRSYAGTRNVSIVGLVKDLRPYYESCLVTIVPVFYGSGTRVKAIESSLFGRVCISTKIGIEGIDLKSNENCYLAESVQDWVQTILGLDVPQALMMGRLAKDYALREFNPGLIAERFLNRVS